jgi:hypothetical protein
MKPAKEKEMELPESLLKKKSKSIDSRKLEHSHTYSHSMKKMDTMSPKPRYKQPFAKKSVDWTSEAFN